MFRSLVAEPLKEAAEPASPDSAGGPTQEGIAWKVAGPPAVVPEQWAGDTASRKGFDARDRLEEALGSERFAYLTGGAGQAALQLMIDGGYVESFIEYVAAFNPALHARNGRDFTSFMAHPRGSLLQYKELVPYIRSPHRVASGVLQALKKNFQDRSKKRPLIVVALGAIDIDGSFHGNESLTPLVSQEQNLVLAIEAGENRKNVLETLRRIAADFGQDKRIQDIVFVGTGGPGRFDLAGQERFEDWKKNRPDLDSPHDGAVRVGDIDMEPFRSFLDADRGYRNRNETDEFVGQLFHILDTRWGRVTPRIVFDASLGSSEKPEDYAAKPGQKPSGLVDLIAERAGKDVDIHAAFGRGGPGALGVDVDGRPTTVAAPQRKR